MKRGVKERKKRGRRRSKERREVEKEIVHGREPE